MQIQHVFRVSTIACLGLALGACASGTGLEPSQRAALYRAHAGEQVPSFQQSRPFIGWTALDDRAVAVWSRPDQAYLLEMGGGGCRGLSHAPTIAITNFMDRVTAGSDKIKVIDGAPAMGVTCRIEAIRTLDAKGLRDSQRALREARRAPRDETPTASEGQSSASGAT